MTGPNYKWVLVAFLFCTGALNYGDRAAIASVFPLIRSDLKMSDIELAAVGSFFLWAYALGAPLGGMLSDRVSRSRVIVGSLAFWSLITFLTGLVANTPQLLFMRVLLGFGEAAYLPASIALIADHHTSQTRATAMGLHTAGLTAGLVAGGASAGYIGEHLGWRFEFFFLGTAGLLLAVAAHFLLRDAVPATASRPIPAQAAPAIAGVFTLIRVPTFVIIILVCMGTAIGNHIFMNWLPLYFNETYRMSLAKSGFVGTFMLRSAGIIAVVAGSLFSDKFAARVPERRMLIQIVAGFLASPFLLIFLLPQPGLGWLNGCIFMYSFIQTFGDSNVTPIMCDLLPARSRSTAFGIISSTDCLAGGIGVMLAGFLKLHMGLGNVFGGLCGLILVASGVLLIGYRFFFKRDLARQASMEAESAVDGATGDLSPQPFPEFLR